MNDTSHGISDDEVVELLGRARLDAPVPHGWHEVAERRDRRVRRRSGGRRGWTLAAAATVVAIGCLGLVAVLQARSNDRTDDAAVPPPPGSVVEPGDEWDPLADLSDDDWVVPTALPAGYEVIVALPSRFRGLDGAALLVGGDDVAEVSIGTRAASEPADSDSEATPDPADDSGGPDTTVEVDGITWQVQSLEDGGGVTLVRLLEREVNGRVVSLSTSGPLEVLVEIAGGLTAVPDAEFDVPRLPFDGEGTTVASLGDADVAAYGVNGVYCLEIQTSDGTRGRSCGSRTEPGTPVVSAVSSSGPAGSFTAGLAQPDVARIEFTTESGGRVVVEPTDESSSFDQRFWITDQPGVGPGSNPEGIVVAYDDGTTVTLTIVGGAWTVTDQRTAPGAPDGDEPDAALPPIDADLRVRPFGAQGDDGTLRVMAFDVESVAGADSAGDVVLTYELDLGFDPAGRSGTVITPEATSDGQLAIEVGCVVEGCLEFVPVNDFRQTSIEVTVRRTAAALEPGTHLAPFDLVFDDGTTEAFDLVLWAEPEPSADVSDAVLASTGPPQRVQTVFTGGNFAYHATAAFGSIWVLNTNSGTVSRIDEISGELLATVAMSASGAGGVGANRLTATDDAVYVNATPAVRIDPDTNEATAIGDGVNTAAIIADNDAVWAASFVGPIVRIDPDMTVTEIGPAGRWVDLAISNGLVWAVEQVRDGGRLIAFDGSTGEIRHDSVLAEDVNGFAVRLVADDTDVVVGVDTSGGGGRTGQLLIVNPDTGEIIDTVTLDSRPEGIVLTPQRIWTSGAVVDRTTWEVEYTEFFGFTITRGTDGSIWGTHGVPNSHTAETVVHRYAPGDLAG